jgi:hypothetical protein
MPAKAQQILHHASELAHRVDATIQLLFVTDTETKRPTGQYSASERDG